MSLDIEFFRLINGLAGQSKFLDLLAIFLADSLAYFLVVGALVIIFLNKTWKERLNNLFFITFITLLSTSFVSYIIRFIYARARPPLVLENVIVLIQKNLHEPSFPSNHAAFFFSLAVAFYFINKKWFKYFFVSAILMGIARIFVGVHYPLDIISGAVIGSSVGLLAAKIYGYNK